nr:FAD-dependent monooxygenase [Scytonema millei]
MTNNTTPISPTDAVSPQHEILDRQTTDCCVVGYGSAGAVLALLARQGIPVMLLEAHKDLDRDFRGDTIHPSVMEIMAELGLAVNSARLASAVHCLWVNARACKNLTFDSNF